MITRKAQQQVRGWFAGRLPSEWMPAAPDGAGNGAETEGLEVRVDREEITVLLPVADVRLGDDASEDEAAAARAGRAKAFREDTRERRIAIAREAEERFGRKVSWGVRIGGPDGRQELFTHVAAPVMTRLRQPERMALDTLVEAGVARSRSEALSWCVRLVRQHEGDWLAELQEAMHTVAEVRSKGPAA